ncbi:Gfo/Idh/MocA family oxidoreductase [Chloroflexus sp.]|uniref:Gfo/Idh/MocA family oxidoreductase n=1 Tax=Chloroflexus sp. TaxID=1904827 RepID=UPI002ADE7325|nr:Gfo/Idh/MocA family oxidoreductase [Chloroflexus sp.]
MKQHTLRAAVIGVGSMGRNHARVYATMPDVELVAVCDTNYAAASSLANIYRCRIYTDYHAMLANEELDLVSVVVPTKHHFAVANAAIARGVHVLVEKPIAATVEQGWLLIEAARRHGVILTVGHIERFNPAIIALKEQLDNHELGNLFQITSRRVGPFPGRIADVGVVIDLATHEIDILNYLIGSPIMRMHVELHRHIHQSHEDMLSALLRFENGMIGILDINWLTPTKIRELSIIGERGMFVANYLTQDLTFYENDSCQGKAWPELALLGVSEGRSIRMKVPRREPLYEELRSFCEAVRYETAPPVSGEAGIAAIEIANQIVNAGLREQPAAHLIERALAIGG